MNGSVTLHRGSRRARVAAQTVLLVVFLLAPFASPLSWNLTVAANALLFGLAATSVNLALGLGGILNLGSAFFLGAGGYGTALLVTQWGWPFVPAAVISIAASVVVAVVIGLLLLRMPRFYLAVATLGLSVALEGVLLAFHTVTGGDSGLITDREIPVGVFTISGDRAWYVLIVVLCALAVGLVHRATIGRRGRLLAMIRDDELAASVLGVHVLRAKVIVFAGSAALLAVAGAVMFAFAGVIVPATAGVVQSVQLLGMSVVGGIVYVSGGLVGAGVLYWLQAMVSGIGKYQSLIYGTAFVLVVFFMQHGLAGLGHSLWRRVWGLTAKDNSKPDDAAPRSLAESTGVAEPAGAEQPAEDVVSTLAGIAEAGVRRAEPDASLWSTSSAPAAGLFASSVVKRFGGLVAVSDVSIVVPPGQVTGLIGTNGAGKSTFLNLVSGVETPDSGAIWLDGEDLTKWSAAQRSSAGIARTFQTPRLVNHCTVIENVMIGLDATDGAVFRRHNRKQERAARDQAMSALERVGLAQHAEKPAGALGSGQRKFVELVRALVLQPKVLLMDEPAVGLSIDEIVDIARWIDEIANSGTAVLLIDHNMDFISGLTDYVYSMDSGQIVASGPASAAAEWTRSWHSLVKEGTE